MSVAGPTRAQVFISGTRRDVSTLSSLLECKETNAGTLTVTISSLSVTNSRRRTVLNVVPNAFPATRVSAARDIVDNSVVEYVQVRRYSPPEDLPS